MQISVLFILPVGSGPDTSSLYELDGDNTILDLDREIRESTDHTSWLKDQLASPIKTLVYGFRVNGKNVCTRTNPAVFTTKLKDLDKGASRGYDVVCSFFIPALSCPTNCVQMGGSLIKKKKLTKKKKNKSTKKSKRKKLNKKK